MNSSDDYSIISHLYTARFGQAPESITPIPPAGSPRRYFTVVGLPATVVATYGPDISENHAFISLARHFNLRGLKVPRVLEVSTDRHWYLQSYLGSISLFSLLSSQPRELSMPLLERTIYSLSDVQHSGAEGLDFSQCFPVAAFDCRSVMWDLNYFKYSFLKPLVSDFSEAALEDDFERFASMLLCDMDSCATFMVRDFQSRNVMVFADEPYLIDFQGGRRGPVEYDLASFLWQAKARFTSAERQHLVDCYLNYSVRYTNRKRDRFIPRLKIFALFRTLQVLGAYGFRGILEQKSHFITSIPPAIDNLRNLIADIPTSLPELTAVAQAICALPQFSLSEIPANTLTVTVVSFSYKNGLPRDFSGNGGGFVFDCRAVHNPGRYDQYKSSTGMDAPVAEFLERQTAMPQFMESVYSIIDSAVKVYLRRGFTSLMVCFGCTGGQHRSVYGAEALTRHLRRITGVSVLLIHREQSVRRYYPAGGESLI